MSQTEVERFAREVRDQKRLQDELKQAAVSNEAIVEFARNKGFDVTIDEIKCFIETKKANMSQEDLEKVCAGKGATHSQVRAQGLVFSVEEAAVFTTTTTMLEAEVVIIAT